MKKAFVLLLSALMLLGLCGCSYTNAKDPLLFIPAEEDGLYLTDQLVLRVDDGIVSSGAVLLDNGGATLLRSEGPVKLPDTDARPNATGMTVAQARTAIGGLLERLPLTLEAAGYLLEGGGLHVGADLPEYTFAIFEETLTEGKSADADESLGCLIAEDAGPLARIWFKP